MCRYDHAAFIVQQGLHFAIKRMAFIRDLKGHTLYEISLRSPTDLLSLKSVCCSDSLFLYMNRCNASHATDVSRYKNRF